MTEIVQIPFSGTAIHSVLVGSDPRVVLRPTLEGLGLDYSAQLKKLRTRSWATVAETATVAEDGKARLMATVDLDTWAMLLANIDENRVNKEARQLVIDYQRGSAKALRAYWTEGGAINPRATAEQLTAVIATAESQMRVLQLAAGLVDAHWLEAKIRHTLARALGEEPEVNPDDRPLSVGEFLEEQGVTGAAQRSVSSVLGKRVLKLFRERHGQDPQKVDRFVDGAIRRVNGYVERDRELFAEAWRQILAATPST